MSSPLDVPFELARRWPGAALSVVSGSGHAPSATTEEALMEAIDQCLAVP